MDFAVPAEHRGKMKGEKLNKYFDLFIELRKLLDMRVTMKPIVAGALRTILKGLEKELEEFEISGRIETILIEIGQNTEKSPRDLRRLVLTQTPVKGHQL